jgi:hypothetical protein
MVAAFLLILGCTFAKAQETAPTPETPPDPAKECAELQKALDGYAEETARIKLTLSFKTNSSYWQGAAAELTYGIERRRLAGNLQAIAFKLGIKRVKDWDVVTLEEKLAYQKKVSQVLENERGRSIMTDGKALDARLEEIERLLKSIRLKYRDLGCADIPAGPSIQRAPVRR